MSEYISRNTLFEELKNVVIPIEYWKHCIYPREVVIRAINECPTADVRENIHAYWELNERGIWNCPKCGTEVYDGDCDKFCRVCGADFKYTPHEQMMIEPKGEKGTE